MDIKTNNKEFKKWLTFNFTNTTNINSQQTTNKVNTGKDAKRPISANASLLNFAEFLKIHFTITLIKDNYKTHNGNFNFSNIRMAKNLSQLEENASNEKEKIIQANEYYLKENLENLEANNNKKNEYISIQENADITETNKKEENCLINPEIGVDDIVLNNNLNENESKNNCLTGEIKQDTTTAQEKNEAKTFSMKSNSNSNNKNKKQHIKNSSSISTVGTENFELNIIQYIYLIKTFLFIFYFIIFIEKNLPDQKRILEEKNKNLKLMEKIKKNYQQSNNLILNINQKGKILNYLILIKKIIPKILILHVIPIQSKKNSTS